MPNYNGNMSNDATEANNATVTTEANNATVTTNNEPTEATVMQPNQLKQL